MHVYFSGIGGVGIGPLALIAKDAGYEVTGSDKQKSRYSKTVADKGIPVSFEQTHQAISELHRTKPIDWFVYTSALPESHPELKFAKDNGIRISKRDEFISELVKDRGLSMIAVAGTHGKTSTTGMLIWAFQELGIPVSYSIGTQISFGPSGQFDPGSKYFVYEADEYDRNFLAFKPEVALLTSVDYDHPDTYPTVQDYKDAFNQLVRQSLHVVTWDRIGEYLDIKPSSSRLLLKNANQDLKLPGQHVRENATLVLKTISDLLDLAEQSKTIKALNEFPGTERRLERLADNLYSDYAHHPAEIKATLQALAEQGKDICVVYQPHQNIRQHRIKDQYGDCFAAASDVYWLPTYLSREDNQRVITPTELISGLEPGPDYHEAELDDELAKNINEYRRNGIVVLMAAGDLDDWARTKILGS